MIHNKIKYIGLLIIFLFIIFHNQIYIDNNLDNDLKKIYCSNIDYNIKDYQNSLININPKYNLTRIKYRDIYNYKHELTVYKGFNDGIEKNQAVVSNNTLVGVISKVYSNSSIVRLITNKESKISIKINEYYGTLKYDNTLYIDDIDGIIKKGDIIYTSGLGNISPNIKIGVVDSINKRITVIPYFNINKLNYLYILGDNNV